MARVVNFAEGEYYHIYNRGVEGRTIFLDEHDYSRAAVLLRLSNSTQAIDIDDHFQKGLSFLQLWAASNEKKRVTAVGAWCLMPNHFHILMRETEPGGISAFMRSFGTAYSMYFNAKYVRKGRLMQGPYQFQHVSNDRHLQYLFSYIHLNPVKLIEGESEWKNKGIADLKKSQEFLRQYKASSLLDYMKVSRPENSILTHDFPWKFSGISGMEREMLDWMTQKG